MPRQMQPRSVVVPSSVTDEELIRVALFRHGGRFPVLSYRHDKGVRTAHHRGDAVYRSVLGGGGRTAGATAYRRGDAAYRSVLGGGAYAPPAQRVTPCSLLGM